MMKKSIKHFYILFLGICLTLILADGSFIDKAFSPFHFDFHKECSDFSKHFEYSHSVCFEDDIVVIPSRVKSNKVSGFIEPLPDISASLKSSFITYIWQPPKFS
jgi:hypothetical protein